MKMTMSTASTLAPRIHRKLVRVATKRLNNNNNHTRNFTSIGKGRMGMMRIPGAMDACENSNDSGLGFDHHMDYPLIGGGGGTGNGTGIGTNNGGVNHGGRNPKYTREHHNNTREYPWPTEDHHRSDAKKCKTEIKMESDDSNDNYNFSENTTTGTLKDTTSLIRTAPASIIPPLGRAANHNPTQTRAIPRCLPLTNRRAPTGPITLTTQLSNTSRNGKVQLQIICQPEQQHRARYQTEGSRGAVKDRTGNGFPIVKLIGYDKPTTLQVFIGTDMGRVAPHMFYQACRVSGKNSTPCVEKKIEGTIVIEVDLDPTKEMMVTCDCVGILKERNVDVEHRFPDQSGPRSKKKSTRCRMVFRTTITHDDGTTETLQTSSQPIVCTQPPGVPEICKKSLNVCPTTGNIELFILGKNFLKDTRVIFQHVKSDVTTGERDILWEETVTPDKEYLQQTHLVCVIPPYIRHDIIEPVTVSLFIVSSGKTSEPHQFVYTPSNPPSTSSTVTSPAFMTARDELRPVMIWQRVPDITPKSELDVGMMPPPASLMPLSQRRPSTNMNMIVPDALKTEMIDESSQNSDISAGRYNENSMDVHPNDNLASMNDNSMDGSSMMQRTGMLTTSSMSVLHHEPESLPLKTEVIDRRGGSVTHSVSSDNLALSMTLHNDNSMDINIAQRVSASLHNENNLDSHTQLHEPNNMNVNVIRHTETATMSMPGVTNGMEPLRLSENNITMPSLINDTAANVLLSSDELKGIDLRMKGATMASVGDLLNTQSPSLATLRRFGVSEANHPLPAQSAQSVENYLTTIENTKGINTATVVANDLQNQKMLLSDQKLDISNTSLFTSQTINNNLFAQTTSSPTAMNSMTDLLPQNVTRDQTNITEPSLPTAQSITNDILVQAQQTTLAVAQSAVRLDALVVTAMEPSILKPTAATVKLDALVNSTAETHMGSPPALNTSDTNSPSQNSVYMSPTRQQSITSPQNQTSPTNPDLLCSQTASSIVQAQSSVLSQSPNLTIADIMNSTQNSANNTLSTEIILNPQVSPSLMCHNSNPDSLILNSQVTNALNNICQSNQIECQIIPSVSQEPAVLSPTRKVPPVAVKSLLLNTNIMDSHETQLRAQQTIQSILQEQQQSLENSSPANTSPSSSNDINNLDQRLNTIFQNGSETAASVNTTSTLLTSDTSANSTNFITQSSQFNTTTTNHSSPPQQEIVVVDTENKPVIPVPVKEMANSTNTSVTSPSSSINTNTGNATVVVGKERLITQEITTMSDTDLISYINPSCFDQV